GKASAKGGLSVEGAIAESQEEAAEQERGRAEPDRAEAEEPERQGAGEDGAGVQNEEHPGDRHAMGQGENRNACLPVLVLVTKGQRPEVGGLPEEDDGKEQQGRIANGSSGGSRADQGRQRSRDPARDDPPGGVTLEPGVEKVGQGPSHEQDGGQV